MEKKGGYKILKHEQKLRKIAEIENRIKFPSPDRLLIDHEKLQAELKNLRDKKILLYEQIKKVIEERHQLIQIEKSGFVCFFKGNYSQANHPEFHYFFEGSWFSTGSITTFGGIDFRNLTPKEFMNKLMNGEGFMPRNL